MTEITVKVRLKPFNVPSGAVPENDFDVYAPSVISISDLDAKTLSGMADEWRAELFRKAGKKDPRHD
jgi:hypothetical protein